MKEYRPYVSPEERIAFSRPDESEREEMFIPMVDVPFQEERIKNVTDRDRFVARHEFGHALVAYKEGFSVDFLSINPKPGEYEGITILKGPIYDLAKAQKVSAGGAVAVNSFTGADSDMLKIQYIKELYGGYSPQEAIHAAKSIIQSLTPEEWAIIEEIIGYKREITGVDIPSVLARARYEVKRKEKPEEKVFATYVKRTNTLASSGGGGGASDKFEKIIKTTVVEDLGDGLIKKYEKVNGIEDKNSVEIFCNLCKQINRHSENCKNKGKSEVLTNFK